MEFIKDTAAYSTAYNYGLYIKKFEKFLVHKDFYFSDINVGILNDYDIINLIQQSRSNAIRAVNTELINLYWNVGAYIKLRLTKPNCPIKNYCNRNYTNWSKTAVPKNNNKNHQ